MKRIYIILGVVVLVLAVSLFWNSSKKNQVGQSHQKVKVGIITMTTGNLAFLGENIVNSAHLAAEKLGRTNDVDFIIEDVGNLEGQGKSAVSAAQKLTDIDKVDFIIDGMTSNGTLASASVINRSKVVMITPLTGGENVDMSGEYIFRNGPSDILGGTTPAQDIVTKFGLKKVALITDNAEYTLDIVKHFKKSFTGIVVSDQVIQPDGNDYRTVITKIKSTKPEAVFINTATGVSARYVIKQIRELGIKVPIFANFLAYGPDLLSVAGQYVEGVYIYDPEFDQNSSDVTDFLLAYKNKFGHESPITFHTTGTYDALRMGLEAVDSVGTNGIDIHDYLLKNIQNWKGFNGKVSFDLSGNSGTGFTLKQIQNGKLVVVK
jgi:ABC-type branched-subunit amino acid transport system substrate-binding protein